MDITLLAVVDELIGSRKVISKISYAEGQFGMALTMSDGSVYSFLHSDHPLAFNKGFDLMGCTYREAFIGKRITDISSPTHDRIRRVHDRYVTVRNHYTFHLEDPVTMNCRTWKVAYCAEWHVSDSSACSLMVEVVKGRNVFGSSKTKTVFESAPLASPTRVIYE